MPLAAFTHSPPSYRNAALAAIELTHDTAPDDVVEEYRALGAPLFFVIEGQNVTVWQVHAKVRPSIYHRGTLDQLHALFSANRKLWEPKRIHNAKTFGSLNNSYQLDFIDAGLMLAIEGEIDGKLDRLLNETLSETVRSRIVRPGERIDDRLLYRTVFRLLAAKVLEDEGMSYPEFGTLTTSILC